MLPKNVLGFLHGIDPFQLEALACCRLIEQIDRQTMRRLPWIRGVVRRILGVDGPVDHFLRARDATEGIETCSSQKTDQKARGKVMEGPSSHWIILPADNHTFDDIKTQLLPPLIRQVGKKQTRGWPKYPPADGFDSKTRFADPNRSIRSQEQGHIKDRVLHLFICFQPSQVLEITGLEFLSEI